MSSTLKDKMSEAGHAVADAAKIMGQKMASGTEQALHYVREKTGMGANVASASIHTHMKVIASCGKTVGVVDGVEGDAVKLTKNDDPNGIHHFIPISWVESVDESVHLRKNSEQVEQNWKSDAKSCGCS